MAKRKLTQHQNHWCKPESTIITVEMRRALREYASNHGKWWRQNLREEWALGGFFDGLSPESAGVLNKNRSVIEPRLEKIQL